MDLLALTVGQTPTTSLFGIGSGVQMQAVPSNLMRLGGGSQLQTHSSESSKLPLLLDQQTSIEQLQELAEATPYELPMTEWVRTVFQPTTRESRSQRELRLVNLTDGTLGYWEVLRRAADWDALGPSTPTEFVYALSCETAGHPRSEAVQSLITVYPGGCIGGPCPEFPSETSEASEDEEPDWESH